MLPLPFDDNLLREQKAEWQALPLMRYANFKKVLLASHVAPEIVIQHLGASAIKFEGGHVSDKRTLKKFLDSTNQPAELYQLTNIAEALAIQYKRWLLTQFTQRYQAITAEAHLVWLEQVVNIAIQRFIMKNKYEAYVNKRPGAFASSQVALIMTIVMMLHDLEEATPRMMHRIVKEPELLQALTKEYFDKLEQALQKGLPLVHEPSSLLTQDMIQSSDIHVESEEQRSGEEHVRG